MDNVLEFPAKSTTENSEWRTCQMFLRGGKSGIRPHDPSANRRRLYQCATTPHKRHHAPQ